MQSMFSNHNGIKLEINQEKYPNTWKLNNTILNNLWVKEEFIKENLKVQLTLEQLWGLGATTPHAVKNR